LKNIKVMVVDDSALMRKLISDMLNSEESIEVIATGKNGIELLDKLKGGIKPDIITLDVEMPLMDGITVLKAVKLNGYNIPIIVLSSISLRGPILTMECLEAGAFDFQPKPSGSISLGIDNVKEELVQKIKMAYEKTNSQAIEFKKNTTATVIAASDTKKSCTYKNLIEAIVIGASTGGPKALYSVITTFPRNIGVPVFVVQHMPVGFTKAFADRLNTNSAINVKEAEDGETYVKDCVYIAPGGFHMEIWGDKKIHLNTEPSIWGVRPAVDKLFISASEIYGPNILSIVLTGMGKDGANGTIVIKKNGGYTMAEDKSTCTIYGMPKAAFETGMVDEVLPVHEVTNQVNRLLRIGR